jgi:hypothetical protein
MNNLSLYVSLLISEQRVSWKLAHDNYVALENAETSKMMVRGRIIRFQFNPERIRSTAANVDVASLTARPCFLCKENMPKEQKSVPFGDKYEIRVNPYPIFPQHLTIPSIHHERQQIEGRYRDMLMLALELNDFLIFYNGPKCGASAPDHMHFQAGKKGMLPLEELWEKYDLEKIISRKYFALYRVNYFLPTTFLIKSNNLDVSVELFDRLYSSLEIKDGEYEPMMNILVWKEGSQLLTFIFPRRAFRPSCYYAEGDDRILISPATMEMAGFFPIPLEKDYRNIKPIDIERIWREVSITEEEAKCIIDKCKAYE